MPEAPTDPPVPEPGPLAIPEEIVAAMIAHCLREKPLECCGLLGGVAPVVSSIHPLRNSDASPVRYTAEPRDAIDAVVWLRDRKAEILAIYHSHPHSAAIPSQTDLRENYWGDMPRIIVSLAGTEPAVRIWRLGPDSYEPLAWRRLPETAGASGATGGRQPG
jgi:[CysO sulfur-carrier protein]-S-L-cysteine hydrolase